MAIRLFLLILFFPAIALAAISLKSVPLIVRVMLSTVALSTLGISLFVSDFWSNRAEDFGINSALDLLLYLTVLMVVTIFSILLRRLRQVERQVTAIAQEVALRDPKTNR